ncbi:DUF11 domain-containing protein [Desertimonas flava]|uniref:DUF11 domain-containing protein n=1 Tax=Desertimonas flava TaxID=2064846 RepID=UPI000E34D834|nr:DUF11 domain-containing protein [Desertimonas flava]
MDTIATRTCLPRAGRLLGALLTLVLPLGSATLANAAADPPPTEPPAVASEPAADTEPPAASDPVATVTEPEPVESQPFDSAPETGSVPESGSVPEGSDPDDSAVSSEAPTVPPASDPDRADDPVIGPLAVGPRSELVKTAAVPGGGAVQPGMQFAYQIYVACTTINVGCVDFVFTDVIPEGLDIVQLPVSNSRRTVSYDPTTRTLTMTYHETLDNPAGEVGLDSGGNEAFDLVVALPDDTPLATGDTIDNVAVVTIDGAVDVTDNAVVDVEVPVTITPIASKQWPGGGVVAGSDAATTATIAVANGSSASSEVTSLAVTDLSTATWEHFDLTTVALGSLPEGATQAQLFLCTQPASACADGDWLAAGTASAPGPLGLGGIDPATVTGVRVEFTAGGEPLPRAPQAGGSVQLGLQLRDTLRSSGEPIAPDSPITVDNCATATASDGGAPVDSSPSCAGKQILSSTVRVTAAKSWTADTFAVAGAESAVSAEITATNASAFPVHQLVIAEPGPNSDFETFDVDEVALEFPSGATDARVQVSYADGTTSDETYGTAQTISLDVSASQVTGIVVTYSGGTALEPVIGAGATAGLALHGHLTAAVDEPTTLDNCADVTANGPAGTTPATDSACDDLPVEAPRVSGAGIKGASQTTIPADQPVTFTMRLTNNGNLSWTDPVLTDPADPAASPNPFDSVVLVSATSTSSPASLSRLIEVTTDGGLTWSAYSTPVPAAVDGVRVRVDGDVPPSGWVQLNITVERRPGVDAAEIDNCFGATVDGGSALDLGSAACATITAAEGDSAATLDKDIVATSLPQWTPGLERQQTGITLRVANTGNLSARYLRIIEDDADFFDAVDFAGFGTITAPAGANRVQVDAFAGGTWIAGTPTTVGSPTLPAGVAPEDVRGLRFTFTSTDATTNDGFVLAPCAAVTAGCAGTVGLVVSPRPTLVSDPTSAPPAMLSNTIRGEFETNVDAGTAQPIDPDTDTLELVPGDPQLDVDKGPAGTVLGPGSFATQTLTVTNNGTTPLADVSIVDALPAGLAFDETLEGDGGPYTVVVGDLPDGSDPAPAPTFELVRDGERVESVRWTFGGWTLPPNATITITFQVGLEPGVMTGQTITNTMGATGTTGDPDRPLACTPPDTAVDGDERFGDGVYCTDTADTNVIAGAGFQARKWVAGDAALGWWHPTLGFVATGDGNCPSADIGGRLYTATPCVALVERGGQFDYVLRVVNAGTESATRMALIDNFPQQGDSGLTRGEARLTEWNNRPTLAGPATYSGPGTATIGYSSAAQGAWCTADLDLSGSGCASGWDDGAGASTTALRLLADFTDDPLEPGAGIEIHFVMNVPSEIAQDADVVIAWNSFAHAEATETAQGGERILPPIEPIKVGVSPLLVPVPPTSTTVIEPTTTVDTAATTTAAPTTTVPTTIVAGGSTSVPPPAGPSTTVAAAAAGDLPETGSDASRVITLAALLLVAAGAASLVIVRRVRM